MTHACIDNIRARGREIEAGVRSNMVTGLVVQGGGMRGVYSMAALMALEECGLGRAFDHVIGSSAGAINGAYFLAQQAKLAVGVYLDDLSNARFINFRRPRRVVDIDFLVDRVLKERKALDVPKVRASASTLHIVLTDVETAKPVVVTNKDEEVDMMEAIRSTAAMPVLYNKVVELNGRGFIDGGVTDSLPLLRAIDLGCTDILVVLTRDPRYRYRRQNVLMRLLLMPFLKRYPTATRKAILSENTSFNSTMDMIAGSGGGGEAPRIAVVHPTDLSKMVTRTCRNRDELLACALAARDDTRRVLGLGPLHDKPFFGMT